MLHHLSKGPGGLGGIVRIISKPTGAVEPVSGRLLIPGSLKGKSHKGKISPRSLGMKSTLGSLHEETATQPTYFILSLGLYPCRNLRLIIRFIPGIRLPSVNRRDLISWAHTGACSSTRNVDQWSFAFHRIVKQP
jgi:hypothetical protein